MMPEKRKRVENGRLSQFRSTSFILLFENAPIWLLSLEMYFVKTISFWQFSDFSQLRSHVVRQGRFFVELLSRFDISKFNFNGNHVSDQHTSSLILVSGSLTFIRSMLSQFPVSENSSLIFIVDKHCKIRKLPDFRPNLTRIKHEDFGGGTKFETLWASMNVDLVPRSTTIRRDISAFLDFSQKSRPIKSLTDQYFLSQYDLLPISTTTMRRKILVDSHFGSSGMGERFLTVQELAALFGVQRSFLPFLSYDSFPLVPTQILDGLLLPLMDRVHDVDLAVRSRKRIRLPRPVPDNSPVYLSSLQKTLPNSWAKVDIMEQQAAKHDDAVVDFAKWDLRILSLWPRATFLIPALRKFILRRQRRRLFLEFLHYIRGRYRVTYDIHLYNISMKYRGLFPKQLGGGTYIFVYKAFS